METIIKVGKRQIEIAAKEYANQNNDDWQKALEIFNFMRDFLERDVEKPIRFDLDTHSIYVKNKKISLRYKEFELAYLLYKNAGTILSREEILKHVWKNVFVDDRTIDVHIRSIRVKIPQAPIVTKKIYGYGWIEKN